MVTFRVEGVYQAVRHPLQGHEMEQAPHPIGRHHRSHSLRDRKVDAYHPETTTSVEGRRARILQRWIIVIIEIIYPDDVFAPVQQPVRHAVANEASSAGHNDRHGSIPPSEFGRLRVLSRPTGQYLKRSSSPARKRS